MKEVLRDFYWLEIWKNQLFPRMEGRGCGLSKKSAKSKNRVYSVWGRGVEHNTVYLDDGLKILQNN
jgi:hypothetical protein